MPEPLTGLLRGINDLKRVHSAGVTGSIAERLFSEAWAMLAAGAPTRIVMCRTVARALTATRLGDLPDVLGSLGIERQGVLQVMYSGLGDHAGAISDAADIPIEELAGSLELPAPATPAPG